MSPATTLAVAAVGGALSLAGAFGATWLQHRYARGDRRELERRELQDRGAAVLGQVETLLVDCNPSRVGINAGPQSKETFDDLARRWAVARQDLAVYAAGHPSVDSRDALRRLSVTTSNSITSAGIFVGALLNRQGLNPQTMLAIARNDHACATAVLDLVESALRGDIDPNDLRARVAASEAAAEKAADEILRSDKA